MSKDKYKDWKNFLLAVNDNIKETGWEIKAMVDEMFTKYSDYTIYRCEAWNGDEMKWYSVFPVGLFPKKFLTEDELIDRIDFMYHQILRQKASSEMDK